MSRKIGLLDRVRLNLLGYIRDGSHVIFRCPKHGMKRRLLSGYTDMFGAHTLIFRDGTYVDCPDCRDESSKRTMQEREIPV